MRLSNKAVFYPLFFGLIVQILTAWNGFFFHSDEYFQIIEFAAHKYNIAPVGNLTWEFTDKIRPSLQVHFFYLWYKTLTAVGFTDRFTIVSLLYELIGVCFFALSNYLVYNKFKNEKYLPALLWINNFFWLIPFLRCKYSAEMMGAFFWILAVISVEKILSQKKSYKNIFLLFVIGFIFSISFYCRFQICFAMIGLAIWFLIKYKNQWTGAAVLIAGFCSGILLNTYLDKLYYGVWTCTPYNYFYQNIIEGKASSFGTSPWYTYILILLLAGLPLACFVLFSFFIKGLAQYKNPFALSTIFFIIGHSIVAHKEERFMFPVIVLMVYIAAEGFRNSPALFNKIKSWCHKKFTGWFLRGGIYFSVCLNIIAVLLFAFTTYKQPVLFIKKFNEQLPSNAHVVSFRQHPYETESGLHYSFLSENKFSKNIEVVNDKDSFINILQQHPDYYYSVLLADAKKNDLEYLLKNKKGIVASTFVWNAGSFLAEHTKIIIPDLWICQQYNEVKK